MPFHSTFRLRPIPLGLLGCFIGAALPCAAQVTAPPAAAAAAITPAPRLALGKAGDWAGARNGALALPGEAVFNQPRGPLGAHRVGFDLRHDGTLDWRAYRVLQFKVKLPDQRAFDGKVTIAIQSASAGNSVEAEITRGSMLAQSQAAFRVSGTGWQTVSVPIDSFDYPRGQPSFLKYIQQVRIGGAFANGKAGALELKDVALLRGEAVALDAGVKGKAADAGQTVEYAVTVSNPGERAQALTLSMHRLGWEEMNATVEPAAMTLAPGESRSATVRVKVRERVVPGGFETHTLQVSPNSPAGPAAKLELLTSRRLAAPYIVKTRAGWDEVRAKAAQHAWAREKLHEEAQAGGAYQPPALGLPADDSQPDQPRRALIRTVDAGKLRAAAVSFMLTGERATGEKIAQVLRAFGAPATGYPSTLRASPNALVQEGEVFQAVAVAYDAVQDEGLLTPEDKRNLEWCFRTYMDIIDEHRALGAISNWQVSMNSGALFAALALQDRERIHHWLYASGATADQMVKGTTDDGWWYEMSVSYNTWVASMNSEVALAVAPFGIDFANVRFQASYSPSWDLRPLLNQPMSGPLEKRYQGRWYGIGGATTRNYRAIRDLWDGTLPFIDYRGVVFGINDSRERLIGGEPYELAYSLYADPRYAEIVRRLNGTRSLLYGVAELPDRKSDLASRSAYADNAGVVMLRSQTAGRPQREQIQTALKYATQGGAHGHYDRNSLLSIMRYGRSFWNPESVWYSYPTPLYVMLVQSSPLHNMVVADLKTQEPVDSPRLMFHSGPMMQVTATESLARFAYPAYLGGHTKAGEVAEQQNRPFALPQQHPVPGTMTQPTEPLLQRRLMVVTDDYIVLADYVKGEQAHTYDALLHPQGLQRLDGEGKTLLRHDAQMDRDPLGSAQFITDANWYKVSAPSVARFSKTYVKNEAETHNEAGPLKLDVHSLWPLEQEIMIATSPVAQGGELDIQYEVQADGKLLDKGQFDSWILGKRDFDLPVGGMSELLLQTIVAGKGTRKNLFWGNARLVSADGKEIALADLPARTDGVAPNPNAGKDYYGGPVVIEGQPYANALAAHPSKNGAPGQIRIDLKGRGAVRFKAALGSDYSTADAETERRVFSSRSSGKEARFLTVIEPFEKQATIRSARASGPDTLRVELMDGRVQEINVSNLTGSGKDIKVRIAETRDGKTVRQEATGALK